uniref:3-hydroxyisobutyryl-CoA hydrolase n=1 Tax=Arcella intermedia TaxID=1963864 RepID=A0A6B2L847_9EUKA
MNRPKALNSLNLSMVRALTPLYKEWEKDPKISNVILRGTGNKAFCAGGDIVQIHNSGKQGGTAHKEFFAEEYSLDYLIGTLSAPHVAFLDGVTMGGGVGLSVHGKFRIATEHTLFAMPETGIGFFPDVGGSYFLPRLNGALGNYLALTGHRLKGVDTVVAGIATHYVPSRSLEALQTELSKLKTRDAFEVSMTISKFIERVHPEKSKLVKEKELIDRIFSLNTVEEIMDALSHEKSHFGTENLHILQAMSPTSLKVTLKLMQIGKSLSFAECLNLEYHLSQVFMKNKDFYEGVRAQLIDKDRKPKWNPSTLAEVKDQDVDQYFTGEYKFHLDSHDSPEQTSAKL